MLTLLLAAVVIQIAITVYGALRARHAEQEAARVLVSLDQAHGSLDVLARILIRRAKERQT